MCLFKFLRLAALNQWRSRFGLNWSNQAESETNQRQSDLLKIAS